MSSRCQNLNMGSRLVHSFEAGRFFDWGTVDAVGATGGILLFWDNRVLKLIDLVYGIFSISCRFRNCEDDFYGLFRECMDRY